MMLDRMRLLIAAPAALSLLLATDVGLACKPSTPDALVIQNEQAVKDSSVEVGGEGTRLDITTRGSGDAQEDVLSIQLRPPEARLRQSVSVVLDDQPLQRDGFPHVFNGTVHQGFLLKRPAREADGKDLLLRLGGRLVRTWTVRFEPGVFNPCIDPSKETASAAPAASGPAKPRAASSSPKGLCSLSQVTGGSLEEWWWLVGFVGLALRRRRGSR